MSIEENKALVPRFYEEVLNKIAENWINLDALGLLQQLGVVPPPGHAS